MADIKKINRQFIFNIIIYVLIVVGFITFGVLSFFLIKNENIVYLIFFIILTGLLIISGIFKNRIDSIINLSYLIKIRHHASKPLPTRETATSIEGKLRALGFEENHKKKKYTLYYKTTKDDIKRIFKRYMLEVVIISRTNAFFIDDVNEEIDRIQMELHKKKMKIDKLFVTQIKDITELNEETKNQIKEIVFIRTNRGIISIINVGLHAQSKQAVLLYSETYRPSLYYEYHINEIKEMIK